jgi:copper homeostasis protein (lipoprotein)
VDAITSLAQSHRRRLAEVVFVMALAAAMGCGSAVADETVADPATGEPSVSGDLPATFEGELPCADCPGIYYHLDLFEDRVFFLRTTYDGRGAGAVVDTIGSWVVASDDGRLALFGGTEAPLFFRVLDDGNLRKLDVEGRDIESSLNYDLRRKIRPDPIEPRLRMRGMYRYMADAAVFTECLSGRRFAVAMEADNIALERAYLKARREPGEALMISLQGRIAERPAMEGDAMVLTVVPEHFIGVWPGETCGARMVTVELENTYWKLTRLGDEPVFLGDQQREPHLVLHSGDGRVAGFGGCNQMTGRYSVENTTIAFSDIASTMMACAEGADTERAFSAALADARSWRLIGEHLDLFDGAGDLVARFEARTRE